MTDPAGPPKRPSSGQVAAALHLRAAADAFEKLALVRPAADADESKYVQTVLLELAMGQYDRGREVGKQLAAAALASSLRDIGRVYLAAVARLLALGAEDVPVPSVDEVAAAWRALNRGDVAGGAEIARLCQAAGLPLAVVPASPGP